MKTVLLLLVVVSVLAGMTLQANIDRALSPILLAGETPCVFSAVNNGGVVFNTPIHGHLSVFTPDASWYGDIPADGAKGMCQYTMTRDLLNISVFIGSGSSVRMSP